MDSHKLWKKYFKRNNYFHLENLRSLKKLIDKNASVIEFGSRGGELLGKLPNTNKLGVNIDKSFPKRSYGIKLINFDNLTEIHQKFDYVIVNFFLTEIDDVQLFLHQVQKLIHQDSVVIVLSFNFIWKPVLDLADKLELKYPFIKEPNWLDESDIENMFALENFRKITNERQTLLPIYIPLLSPLVNKYLSKLPFIRTFCVTQLSIFRQIKKSREYSVSVIIPARNEAGTIRGLLGKIPLMGTGTEVIFIEGHSKDDTYNTIATEIGSYRGKIKSSIYKQAGIGKADAVKLGFSKAKGEILMILDADLSVDPSELKKFYESMKLNKGDFVMGSRFVYPQETQAMRNLNYLGNKVFSLLFTFLLGQRVKDTLCGTKVLFREHYRKAKLGESIARKSDPFGDFELIFSAKKLQLKILEIPVRYKERTYGVTNISRFRHGWLLLKVFLRALVKFKFS